MLLFSVPVLPNFPLLSPPDLHHILDTHPPDPALAAEFGRFHWVLGPTSMTELALHAAIVNAIPVVDIIPEK